jgi:hypothetical protein
MKVGFASRRLLPDGIVMLGRLPSGDQNLFLQVTNLCTKISGGAAQTADNSGSTKPDNPKRSMRMMTHGEIATSSDKESSFENEQSTMTRSIATEITGRRASRG